MGLRIKRKIPDNGYCPSFDQATFPRRLRSEDLYLYLSFINIRQIENNILKYTPFY